MAAHQVNIYFWLIDAIASGHLTRQDLDRRWVNCRYNDNKEQFFPERRFHRYKNDIQEIFDIEICCNRANGNIYYIANKDDISIGQSRQWLLSAMSVHSMLDQAKDIEDCIIYENIPAGTQYLTTIVEAIRSRTKLKLSYHNFGRNETYQLELSPYCLKAFKQRWYVAGNPSTHAQEVRVYALDRILSVQPTDHTFIYPTDFSASAFFIPYYGVFRNETPTKIVVMANETSTRFLRLLPLHHSQKEVLSHDGKVYFEYFVAPTFDFIQELRTHGTDIRIMEPESLVEIFRQEAEKAYHLYCEKI
jgi:hypothetical protein